MALVIYDTVKNWFIALLQNNGTLQALLGGTGSDKRVYDYEPPNMVLNSTYPAYLSVEIRTLTVPRVNPVELQDAMLIITVWALNESTAQNVLGQLDVLLDHKMDATNSTTFRVQVITHLTMDESIGRDDSTHELSMYYELHGIFSLTT